MNKHFICLANSLKRGGRCVAGVEVEIDDKDNLFIVKSPQGIPSWIRPIDTNTEFGEIPNKTAQNIPLLSVVKLTEVEPCPHQAHSEDVYFLHMEIIGSVLPHPAALNGLVDTKHDFLFYDGERSISIEQFTRGDYSLMLIHACDILVLPDTTKKRAKFRMEFANQGHHYNMPVTDPIYLNYLENTATGGIKLQEAYLTLSLGMAYENRHHKLIAGVLFADSKLGVNGSKPQNLILRRKIAPQWKKQEERKLTVAERNAIRYVAYTPTFKGPAAHIQLKEGKDFFLQIEEAPDMEPRKQINLNKIRLVTYEDDEGNVEQRVRITTQHLPCFNWICKWLKRFSFYFR